MSESRRILILEDNPADVELIQFELQEAGLNFTSKTVKAEKEYVQAIQDYCPDLILSDYDLITYNGALALAEANRSCPDTPFMKSARRIPRPVDGDECGAGVRGMQSPSSSLFKMPRPAGGVIHYVP
jgi:CheY-like chemotaxis protein